MFISMMDNLLGD